MTNARVIIDDPCSTCGGRGMDADFDRCRICHGAGTVPRVVTCASCRWWEQMYDRQWYLKGRGICTVAECDSIRESEHQEATGLVFAREGGNYCTMPNHGCSMWEARDAS